jgi:hypothetical protein
MKLEIVSATRKDEKTFWAQSALGLSLRRLAFDRRVAYTISFNNSSALADTFNPRITARDGSEILVFAHDDVWLDDFFIVEHVAEGLNAFDVIGVVGNRRRAPNQPGWAFLGRAPDGELRWDDAANLSGAIAHGSMPFGPVVNYGPGGPCELLDGVLLAAHRSRLSEAGVLFDPALRFHLYDLDFCRTARAKGLSLGTWPLAITHQSGGAFGGPEWERMYALYLEKWRD